MKLHKWITVSVLLAAAYTITFLVPLGWIAAIVIPIAIIIYLFVPFGGTATDVWTKTRTEIKDASTRDVKIDAELDILGDKKIKVAVGLSGGVDSAVSALLLQQLGYEVEGFFMVNWDSKENGEFIGIDMEEVCTQTLDFADAKKVADHLNIKLTKVNFVKEYREKVFNSFLADMEAGITPNPDVLCNRYIKFGAFTDQIFKNNPDIDYVATGHYANIAFKKGKYFLSSALDQTKDQTYFLAEIDKDILHKVKFPLANYTKKEVREIAEKHNIPVMHKEDSMGICFIGERNFSQFLSNYFEPNPGDIVDTETDKVVGQHNGIVFFTIGQRKGLDIGGHHKPYFVTGKDKANNIVYVTQGKTNDKLFTRDAYATNFNLLVDQSVVSGKVIFKVRHSHGKYKGIVKSFDGKSIHIESLEEVHAITPGQELVLYKKGIVLGGGKIISKEHYESI